MAEANWQRSQQQQQQQQKQVLQTALRTAYSLAILLAVGAMAAIRPANAKQQLRCAPNAFGACAEDSRAKTSASQYIKKSYAEIVVAEAKKAAPGQLPVSATRGTRAPGNMKAISQTLSALPLLRKEARQRQPVLEAAAGVQRKAGGGETLA